MRSSSSSSSRILTLISLAFLVILSFALVVSASPLEQPSSLQKRIPLQARAVAPVTGGNGTNEGGNGTGGSSSGASSGGGDPTPTPTPTPTPQPSSTKTTTSSTKKAAPASSTTSAKPAATATPTVTSTVIPTVTPVLPITVPTAETTFSLPITGVDAGPSTTDDSDAGPTDTSTASASSVGFWGNKSAVAATFTVVTLVLVGLLIAGIVTYFRRRNASRMDEDDGFFEKSWEPSSHQGHGTEGDEEFHNITQESANDSYLDRYNYGGGGLLGSQPNTPSAYTEPSAPNAYGQSSALNAYSQSSAPNVYSTPSAHPIGQTFTAGNYGGIAYPPGASYDDDDQYETPQQQGNHPYASASRRTAGAPPTAFRGVAATEAGRDSGYQQSLDSFYGAYAR